MIMAELALESLEFPLDGREVTLSASTVPTSRINSSYQQMAVEGIVVTTLGCSPRMKPFMPSRS